MDCVRLAERLFPNSVRPLSYYEELYPERGLDKKAEVTRVAPSPTGFIHLGNLFSALANERIAHQSGGVFFLRVEDTDSKRRVDGAVEAILAAFDYFDIRFDEGAEVASASGNDYGPYYQSMRTEIYHAYAKDLVSRGLAYPCFCTAGELDAVRERQKEQKLTPGYYGSFARCRELGEDEVFARLDRGEPYVLRLRSGGDGLAKLTFKDEIKGEISVTANDQDIVLLKSDGIPTYHFAHAVDDHLMRTTLVVRGEEWLSSLPIHLELFELLNFRRPRYAHTCQIMKLDGDSKRKLSKRTDPEAALSYYRSEGYHPGAVKTYLMTLLNSNFEEWLLKNPDAPIETFKFSTGKMSQSGTLFDLAKLDDISRTYLSRLSAEEMYAFLRTWAEEYSPERVSVCLEPAEYMLRVLALCMGTGGKKRRKDFICARQALDSLSYFFDGLFKPDYSYSLEAQECAEILRAFAGTYNYADQSGEWFDKIKAIAAGMGYAAEMSDYRKNPEAFKGSVGDVAEVIRVAVTGLKNTPDLWTILQILGEERVRARLDRAVAAL